MNGQYGKKLKEIEFYKTHPEYLPFVGDKYDEFKILQVGESRYIGQSDNYAPFGLEDFDQWMALENRSHQCTSMGPIL
jgi:hypothetical protein